MQDPTPEEIKQRCLEIQQEWSEEERFKRLRADWRPVFWRADGQRGEMSSEAYHEHHEQRASILVATNQPSAEPTGV